MAQLGGAVDSQRAAVDPKGRICWLQMPCPRSLGEEQGCLNSYPHITGRDRPLLARQMLVISEEISFAPPQDPEISRTLRRAAPGIARGLLGVADGR